MACVRAYCGVCVWRMCPCLGDPKEQSGGATVVIQGLCYFRGVRMVRNFAYVRIIRIPHHFTRSACHIQGVCVRVRVLQTAKPRSHGETALL